MITIIYRKGKATVSDMQEGTCRSVGYPRVTNIRNEAIKSVKKTEKISKPANPCVRSFGQGIEKAPRGGVIYFTFS